MMHFEQHGMGRPVLLLHGLGSSLRTWDLVVPHLAAEREVIAVDLPGFGATPPLQGAVTIAALTDAVAAFIADRALGDVDVVGSSLGARVALELAARGHGGNVVALAPLGFWSDRQAKIFNATVGNSMKAMRAAHSLLSLLGNNPIGRSTLLAQFSARPWALGEDFVLTELRGFKTSPSLNAALDALVKGPKPEAGTAASARPPARITLGWGRQDKVAVPSEAERVTDVFPQARVRWFEDCGHYPQWDQPEETVKLILDASG
ncbi:alpha/beta fold hydrolase [Cryobacterium tepidiphilum]|jgi:pimeloyl-ACP methyl ester carboxylesterase|nr:alpha/beta fold hydrolase [Cryobacterium tepidiphilum]